MRIIKSPKFKYIINRFLMAIVTIWAVTTITFFLMHSIPGDPFTKEGRMPPGVYQNLMKYYKLDKPLFVQYGMYLKSLTQLDFGPSLKSESISVNRYIRDGAPISFHLGIQALIIAVALGLILGVIASLNHNRWPDYLSMVLAIIGISVPGFLMATFLINYIAVGWGILPVAQWGTWQQTVLPSISLALMPMAFIARLMRSSMLEVMGQDFIKTAKAKGLTQNVVILRHAIRNAILPIVSVLGIIAANLVTGSFIIEHIFGIPGIGEMFVKGIQNRDYPVILGSTIFYCAILVLLMFVVDVAYTFIDPRIKLSGGTSDEI